VALPDDLPPDADDRPRPMPDEPEPPTDSSLWESRGYLLETDVGERQDPTGFALVQPTRAAGLRQPARRAGAAGAL
jgi:hypothetical protein